MPFTCLPCLPEEHRRYRIWLVKERKCLVLKKNPDLSLSFTFAGVGAESSSKVKATEKKNFSDALGYHLSFDLDGKEYVLDVSKDGEKDTVTAREVTEKNPVHNADYFVPDKDVGPFETLKLGSDRVKGLALNEEDQRLTIKKLQDNQPGTLVICDSGI